MLLAGYRHAIIIKCPKAKKIIEEESGESGKGGSGSINPNTAMELTPADIVYEFGKEGSFVRVEGFVDKEDAITAHQDRLELIAIKKFELEEWDENQRMKLLDLEKHLGPELNNE